MAVTTGYRVAAVERRLKPCSSIGPAIAAGEKKLAIGSTPGLWSPPVSALLYHLARS